MDEEKLRAIRIGDVVGYVNLAGTAVTGQVIGWKLDEKAGHHIMLANDEIISLKRVFERKRPGCESMTWPARLTSTIAVQ